MYTVCSVCGRFGKLVSVSRFERGGRVEAMHQCRDCFADYLDRLSAGERSQTLPRLKEVKTSYTFAVSKPSEEVVAELAGHKFGGCAKRDLGKYLRVTSPVYNRLNSPIRYQESIRLMEERFGCRVFGLRVKFATPSLGISKVYTCRVGREGWADFIRESEDDYCNLIGCPQWSALKTGTRVK